MRMDLSAQIAVSFLAHIGVFFAANSLLSTTDIPYMSINVTHALPTDITVCWEVTSKKTIVSRAQISLFTDVFQTRQISPVIVNRTRGVYSFSNLQPDTPYNVCLVITTEHNVKLSKCTVADTSSTGLSRLRLFNSSTPQTSVTILLVLFVLFVFVAVFLYSFFTTHKNMMAAKQQTGYQRSFMMADRELRFPTDTEQPDFTEPLLTKRPKDDAD